MSDLLAALHAPLTPILRDVLAHVGWRRGGLVLDIACGASLKRDLLLHALDPDGRVVGIDIDRTALETGRANHPDARGFVVVGDALALPLRAACADGVACIAALGVFADEGSALCELRRVLVQGGVALVVTGAQCWSAVHPWPPALVDALAAAYRQARAASIPPANDLCEPLARQLHTAGFAHVTSRAFLLEASISNPLAAELAVADWSQMRAYLAPYVSAEMLAQAASSAAAPEDVALVPVLLAAVTS